MPLNGIRIDPQLRSDFANRQSRQGFRHLFRIDRFPTESRQLKNAAVSIRKIAGCDGELRVMVANLFSALLLSHHCISIVLEPRFAEILNTLESPIMGFTVGCYLPAYSFRMSGQSGFDLSQNDRTALVRLCTSAGV